MGDGRIDICLNPGRVCGGGGGGGGRIPRPSDNVKSRSSLQRWTVYSAGLGLPRSLVSRIMKFARLEFYIQSGGERPPPLPA